MKDKDFLDRMIDERKHTDPEFASQWSVAELRLELARIRKRAGLTQAQLAKRLGVPQPRVADIERDPTKASFGRILAYLNAMGASLDICDIRSKGLHSDGSGKLPAA